MSARRESRFHPASAAVTFLLPLLAALTAASPTTSTEKTQSRVVQYMSQESIIDVWAPWTKQQAQLGDAGGGLQRRRVSRHLIPSSQEKIDFPCNVCLGVADALIGDLQEGISVQEIIDALIPLCATFVYDTDVCQGILYGTGPTVAWVIENSPSFDPNRFCAEGIGATNCDEYVPNPEMWLVDLPDVPKPDNVEYPAVPEGTEGVKVLHISDMHLDMIYEEGSEEQCSKIICCQSIDGPADSPNTAAGLFGSYADCDIPLLTVQATLDHVLSQHPDVGLVLFTGDLPAHDLWRQSVEGNLDTISQGMNAIRQAFAEINVPVFTALGNHEPFPVNVYSFDGLDNLPAELSTQWVYDAAWREWSTWLPADQEESVRHSGSFSVLVPGTKLRVISFNDIYAYDNNWLIWMDIPDPNGVLAWLAQQLQAAETAGEAVYLISHIPPGSMIPVWSHNFHRIVSRYEATIRGQFYGHTHNDEINVFYDGASARATSVAFMAPSITTYTELNPGYRVFYADGNRGVEDSTWALMDHETWLFDLEPANAAGVPDWYKFYNFKAAYGLPDLSPASMAQLADQLGTDQAVFDFYYNGYWKNSPRKPDCDAECRADYVCDAVTADSSDTSRC